MRETQPHNITLKHRCTSGSEHHRTIQQGNSLLPSIKCPFTPFLHQSPFWFIAWMLGQWRGQSLFRFRVLMGEVMSCYMWERRHSCPVPGLGRALANFALGYQGLLSFEESTVQLWQGLLKSMRNRGRRRPFRPSFLLHHSITLGLIFFASLSCRYS